MITIELFGAPGCTRCADQRERLRRIATAALGEDGFVWRDVDVLAELDHAVDVGVLTMPAIAVDGRLVFARLPDESKWRRWLHERAGSDGGA